MKSLCRSWILGALALLLAAPAALAEDRAPFRQEELDQMLAPVALYPDPLLSQVLMASTYPLEIVQAARWSRANPGLKGQAAVNAVEPMDWEASVKSLTAFPQVLAMMSEKLEWTERLGEAFLAQQADVMNTVQELRQRAEAAGHLRPSEQMRVERQGDVIVIEPPAPGIVYVPYYDPALVYGPWWWPAYPPVAWAPPPAYYAVSAYPPAWLWGSGIVLSTGFFFGHFDWPHRHVRVRHFHRAHPHAHPVHVHRAWHHNPVHRRGVPFRSTHAHQRFEQHRAAPGASRSEPARADSRPGSARAADTRSGRWEDSRRDGRRDTGASPATTPAQSNPPTRTRSVERRSEAPADARPSNPQPVESRAPTQRPVHSGRFDRPSFRTGDRETSRQPSRQPERRASTPTANARDSGHTPAVRAAPPPQVIPGGGHAARGVQREQATVRERAPAPRAAERAAPRASPALSGTPRAQNSQPRSHAAPRRNERSRERSANRDAGRRS